MPKKPTQPEIEIPSPASLEESDTASESPVVVSTARTARPARLPQQPTQRRQHPASEPSRGYTQHPHPAAAAAAAPVARLVGQQPQQPTAGPQSQQPAAASSPREPAAAADEPTEWQKLKVRMAEYKKRQSKNAPRDQGRSWDPPRKVSRRARAYSR